MSLIHSIEKSYNNHRRNVVADMICKSFIFPFCLALPYLQSKEAGADDVLDISSCELSEVMKQWNPCYEDTHSVHEFSPKLSLSLMFNVI